MQKIRFFFELFAHSETQKLRINLATSYSVWTFRRRKNPFLWLPSSKISQLETHPLFPSPPLLFSPKKNFFTMFSFHLAPQIRRSKILSTCLYTPYMYASTLFIIVALGNGASAAVSKKIAPRAIWCGPNFTWNKSRYEKKKDFSGDRKSRHPNHYLFHSLRASSVISRIFFTRKIPPVISCTKMGNHGESVFENKNPFWLHVLMMYLGQQDFPVGNWLLSFLYAKVCEKQGRTSSHEIFFLEKSATTRVRPDKKDSFFPFFREMHMVFFLHGL